MCVCVCVLLFTEEKVTWLESLSLRENCFTCRELYWLLRDAKADTTLSAVYKNLKAEFGTPLVSKVPDSSNTLLQPSIRELGYSVTLERFVDALDLVGYSANESTAIWNVMNL